MPKWTEAQQLAIDARNQNLLVSAAAGSGKTAVLIERIVGLIVEDQVPIDTFLIATYTNAAAGEMRERLLNKILEKLEERPEDRFLKEQMSRIGMAQISTIHSFCITVVRTYFYKLSLDPTFKMGDTYDLELLREEAVNDVFEKEYFLEALDFLELVEAYSGNRGDTALREMVLKVYDFVLSKPYPFQWLENMAERYNVGEETNYWIDRYKNHIRLQLEEGIVLLNKCLPLCQIEEGPMAYLSAIESDLAAAKTLLSALDQSLDDFNEQLHLYKSQRLKAIPKARKEIVDPYLQEQVKHMRDLYKKKVVQALQKSSIQKDEQGLISEFVVLYRRLHTLLRLVQSFKESYQALKLEKNLLDFSDLEHYTIELLKDEGVRQNLQNKFAYIFVDEYQDANEIQEAIIQGIARQDNVFMVGDVKQSIYKFRLADPSIFLSKMEAFKDGGINRRIDLSKNFRSKTSILESTNELFKWLMSKDFGEINYDETAYLYPGRTDADDDTKPIEIQLIVDKDETRADDLDGVLTDLKGIEKEAHYISRRMTQLHEAEGYDYSDMVVLLRGAKTDGPVMAEIFASYGIPTYLEAGGEYFEAIEVKILLALLNIVDNIEQDVALLTVLRSPFGGFLAEDLVHIRKDDKKVTYYEAMQGYLLTHDNTLAEKVKDFLMKIESWSERCRLEPLDTLVWEMIQADGFLTFIRALPEGERRLKNIEVLMDKVSQLQGMGGLSLYKLIRVLDKIEDFSVDMGGQGVSQQEQSAVKIMTIHKSKGLEFPVVFLAGANKRFNLRDAQGSLLLHKDHGLGLKYVDPWKRLMTKSMPQLVIQQCITEENLAEEMRVLYVALTRPVERLIVTGVVKNIDTAEKKWSIGGSVFNLKQGQSYLDWMMMILSEATVDRQYFHVEKQFIEDVFTDNRLSTESSHQLIALLENHHLAPETIQDYNRIITMDTYEVEESLPAKMSVTGLKKIQEQKGTYQQTTLPTLTRQPKFLKADCDLSPEERGTRIHHLLRHLDYSNIHDLASLKNQISHLKNRGIIVTEGLQDEDYHKLMWFFESPLGKQAVIAKRLKKETPFVFTKKLDGTDVLIQGIIDLYFETPQGIILVDFKTDRIHKGMVEKRSQQYRQQVDLYTEALRRILNKPVKERYIYFLELGIANRL